MKIGQRRSKQRELILEELKGLTCHPTADELYERVRKRLPNISLGTVYRNLELLAENGIILKIETGGKNRFDGYAEPHPHIRCVQCGKVDDVMEEVNAPAIGASAARGYEVKGCSIEYFGFCPECLSKVH
ncbi:Fur family transcriptional regulator [Maridesulfovibrio sp.]|uniref:Fur family transcriptional regulator n=1 Tax=Maridesulfovibrio sp. TaxID=2795000 RepID=UPI0029F5B31D|nr:transcriptional repressor [Maridesulfovibrio sp.]